MIIDRSLPISLADVMSRIVEAPCCHNLIGDDTCLSEWVMNSPNCPKCRDDSFGNRWFWLSGLEDIIDILQPVNRGHVI